MADRRGARVDRHLKLCRAFCEQGLDRNLEDVGKHQRVVQGREFLSVLPA